MYDLTKTSVDHLSADVFKAKINCSEVLISDLLQLKSKVTEASSVVDDIALFYLSDHLLFKLQQEYEGKIIPQDVFDVLKECRDNQLNVAKRCFTFTVYACVSEVNRIYVQAQKSTFFPFIASYSQEYSDSIKSGQNLNNTINNCKSVSLERFLTATATVFSTGKWNFGAGGILWADIARAYLGFIRGSSSMHEATDLAFSLCHDRGSYFDRIGWVPGFYKPSNYLSMFSLLDAQAIGEVPQFLKANPCSKNVSELLTTYFECFPQDRTIKLSTDKLKLIEKQRLEDLNKKWELSRQHHAAIAGVKHQSQDKTAPQEKIDDLLIASLEGGLARKRKERIK